MEMISFLKTGVHPLYPKDLSESDFLAKFSDLSKTELNERVDLYHDQSGTELSFLAGGLDYLSLRIGFGYVFTIAGVEFDHDYSFAKLCKVLHAEHIEWEFIGEYCFEKQYCIRTSSGIYIVYEVCDSTEELTKVLWSGD